MRELLILRHAKSDWDDPSLADYDRPLNGRGKRDAVRMGAWLKSEGLVPDYVISSPALRARKTVKRVCRECDFEKASVVWGSGLYAATLKDLTAALRECPDSAQRVLLVGHNPGLEELLDHLVGGVDLPDDGKLLPTASVALLDMPDDWKMFKYGEGTLQRLMRPAWLPK